MIRQTLAKGRFAARILQSNVQRLPRPYKLLLGLTYWCNSRCLTCRIWERRPKGELWTDEIRELFRRNSYLSWVNLTGGEIFLRRDLPEVLNAVLTECPDLVLLNFATNGLQPRRTERVMRDMPRHLSANCVVTVSVDGPREVNDRVRGIPGDFDRAVDTYRRLRSLRDDLSVYVGMTLSGHNAGMVEETYDSLRREIPSLRYGDLHVNVAQHSAHYYGNQPGAPDARVGADIAKHLARQPAELDTMRLVERSYLRHMQRFLTSGRTPVPCQALSASCYVDPQGIVYPCITFSRPLGNLRDAQFDLASLWQGSWMTSARTDVAAGRCPHCWTPCEAYQSILGGLARWR